MRLGKLPNALGPIRRTGREPVSRRARSSRFRLGIEALEGRTLMATNPVAAFGFDAGSGSTVADTSGNGNNGTINGATWTTGRFGGASPSTAPATGSRSTTRARST